MLIRAAQHLPSARRVVIVGQGAQKAELMALAESLNVTERVQFLDYVDDAALKSLYANCSAVFYAPYDEDYGLVTLEAMQSRKPVVTTVDAGGVLEFVRAGETGLIAENDPANIAASIESLFARNPFAKQLGQHGFDSIQHIRWDDVIEKLTA